MALSGSFYTNVNSHWRLSIEWTGSQSISGNYTDITAKMYWQGLDQYGTTYSTVTKDGAITIAGQTFTFSGAGLAKLTGAQKKLISTQTKRINHNSDGTASVSFDGYFDAELTLSGTYYGRINLTAKTYTLNTIPRASSLSGKPNWTAGSNLSLSVSRHSSSFTHTLRIYVENKTTDSWNFIKEVTGVGTSTTVSFNTVENKDIFWSLESRSSARSKVILYTYSGSTLIGSSVEYLGTVTAPSSSLLTTAFDHYVYVDQTISGSITRYNSAFTHTVEMKLGSFTKTLTNVGTSFSWTPTATEQASLYAQMPTVLNKDGSIIITTYLDGQIVRTARTELLQFHVRNSNPTFSDANISYKDTNATTVGITGNDQSIIQGQSSVTAYVNTSAKAINGASLVKYIVSVAGVEKDLTTATGSVSIGKVNLSANQSLEITAVDSRGLTTKVSKTVKMIPYQEPKLVLKLDRANKFESTTRIDVSGTFSPLPIDTNGTVANKNLLQALTYSYKPKGNTSWTATDVPITFTTSGSGFMGDNFFLELDNTKSFDFEFKVTDKITSNTDPATVGTGQPILFIDSEKKSVGIGVFPTNKDALEIKANFVAQDGFFRHMYSKKVWMPVIEERDNGDLSINAHGKTIQMGDRTTTTDVKVNVPVHIHTTGDSGTTNNNGLMVGDEAGYNLKMDGNELIASNNGAISNLHLQTDGGSVYIGNNTTETLVFEKGAIRNESTIRPSLQNGYANYSTTPGYEQAGYFKDKNGVVHITGLVKNATDGVIFTLPAGYRPRGQEIHWVNGGGVACRIDIYASGNVSKNGGGVDGSWVSLAGISFRAEN